MEDASTCLWLQTLKPEGRMWDPSLQEAVSSEQIRSLDE